MFNIKRTKEAYFHKSGGASPEKHRWHDPAHYKALTGTAELKAELERQESETSRMGGVGIAIKKDDELTSTFKLAGDWQYRRIYGKLAERWGFKQSDQLTNDQYKKLVQGEHPETGVYMGHTKKSDRVAYADLVFSATPGAGAIMYAQAPEAEKVKNALDAGLDRTIDYITQYIYANMSGANQPIQTDEFAFIRYDESVGSPTKLPNGETISDCQPHFHLILLNRTHINGVVHEKPIALEKILDGDTIKSIGAYYRQVSREELEKRGIQTVNRIIKGDQSYYEVANVTPELVDRFSNRQKQIEREKEKNGKNNFLASLENRDHSYKNMPVDNPKRIRHEIQKTGGVETNHAEEWRAENEKYGEKMGVLGAQIRRGIDPAKRADQLDIWLSTLERITEKHSSTKKEIFIKEYIGEVMRRGLQLDDINQAWQTARWHGLIIESKHENRYTTPEAVLEQIRIRQLVKEKREGANIMPDSFTQNAFKKLKDLQIDEGLTFEQTDDQQKNAIKTATTSNKRVTLINSKAGSGKTSILNIINHATSTYGEGIRITAIAPTNTAKEQIKMATGIEAFTVYSYLQKSAKEKTRRKAGFLIIDEGSMINRTDFLNILETAKIYNDKVVILGDANQLQPVGAGQDFREIIRAKDGEIVTLEKSYRQNNPRLKEIITVAEDSPAEAIGLLTKDKNTFQSEEEKERLEQVQQWYDVNNVNNQMVLAFTHRETRRLNRVIRDKMRNAGKISRQETTIDTKDEIENKTEQLKISVGDVLVSTSNIYRTGLQKKGTIWNGERFTVTDYDNEWLRLQHITSGETHAVRLDKPLSLERGFATTIHRAQGSQASRVLMYVDTGTGNDTPRKELSYVGMSRTQDELFIITDSITRLRNQSEISEQEYSNIPHPMTPDQLRGEIAKRQDYEPHKLKVLDTQHETLIDYMTAEETPFIISSPTIKGKLEHAHKERAKFEELWKDAGQYLDKERTFTKNQKEKIVNFLNSEKGAYIWLKRGISAKAYVLAGAEIIGIDMMKPDTWHLKTTLTQLEQASIKNLVKKKTQTLKRKR